MATLVAFQSSPKDDAEALQKAFKGILYKLSYTLSSILFRLYLSLGYSHFLNFDCKLVLNLLGSSVGFISFFCLIFILIYVREYT